MYKKKKADSLPTGVLRMRVNMTKTGIKIESLLGQAITDVLKFASAVHIDLNDSTLE